MPANLPLCPPGQVSGQSEVQTAQVRLLVDNTRTPAATNLSDLLLLDNVTGLSIRESPGNRTSAGFQTFRKKFLQGDRRARAVREGRRMYLETLVERVMCGRRVLDHGTWAHSPRVSLSGAGGTTARYPHPKGWICCLG